jgi:hypothetical protein
MAPLRSRFRPGGGRDRLGLAARTRVESIDVKEIK